MKQNVTLKDIAQKLNTSVMTVSKALNNHPDISAKRKQEVLDLAASMNYVPNAVAKSLRNHKSKFIGIIVGDNSNPYYARIIKGAEEALSKKGYHTLIINSQEDPQKELMLVDQLRSIHIAGVLLTPAAGNCESARHLDKYGSVFGTFIGALLIGTIRNGLNLLNVDSSVQPVVIGLVVVMAVLLDMYSKSKLAEQA